MSEYDNTNRGAGFPPYEEEKMVLTGKINVDGLDTDVIYVAGTTKSGQRVLRIYQKMGICSSKRIHLMVSPTTQAH